MVYRSFIELVFCSYNVQIKGDGQPSAAGSTTAWVAALKGLNNDLHWDNNR